MASIHSAFMTRCWILLALIGGFVLLLLVYVIYRFNANANPVPTLPTTRWSRWCGRSFRC